MREADPNCAKNDWLVVVQICAGNNLKLKCEYVRDTAKSATPQPPHLIAASAPKR